MTENAEHEIEIEPEIEHETEASKEKTEVEGSSKIVLNEEEERTVQRPTESCWAKFKRKFGHIPKTVAACFIMFTLGLVLILVGKFAPNVKQGEAISLYVLGGMLLIPSIYAGYILYNVFNDRPGFDLDGLPIYDDLL